jgi:hypothetical protein
MRRGAAASDRTESAPTWPRYFNPETEADVLIRKYVVMPYVNAALCR